MVAAKRRRPVRLVIVCDEHNWAIGTMAASIRKFAASDSLQIDIVSSEDFTMLGIGPRLVSRADLVHWLSTIAWPTFGASPFAATSIVSVHHIEPKEKWKCAMRRPKWVITHSQDAARQLEERCSYRPSAVLPYGYEPDLFSLVTEHERLQARRNLGIPQTAHVIGTFGNASGVRKGVQLLIDTLRLLPDDHERHLVLAGRGWEQHLQALDDAVTKVHHVPVETSLELRERYAALDLYLCTSAIEGGPLPVLEALACGVPVVSTAVGHVCELITTRSANGVVADASPDALAAAITAVIGSSAPCQAGESVARSVEAWSWQELGARYRTHYTAAAASLGDGRSFRVTCFAACEASIVTGHVLRWKQILRRRLFTLLRGNRSPTVGPSQTPS